eukprot:9499403-Pyramimonas_sp.AAC.1
MFIYKRSNRASPAASAPTASPTTLAASTAAPTMLTPTTSPTILTPTSSAHVAVELPQGLEPPGMGYRT